MTKDFWKGMLLGAIIVIALVFVTVLAEWDDNVKKVVNNTFTNIENPIKLVPGNEAIQTYVFDDDPTKGASCVGHGPTCGQSLVTFSDSPDNSNSGKTRAYITIDDGKYFLFALVVKPDMTISETWKYLGNFETISNVTWIQNQGGIDDDELLFIAGTKACRALPSTETVECH